MITLKKILVATDFGEAAEAALRYGRALARNFNATLYVMHVADDVSARLFAGEAYVGILPDVQRDVDASARKQLAELLVDDDPQPLPTKSVMVTSNAPALAIVQYAKDNGIDLIVLGTHGRTGIEHLLLGSVAEKILRLAPCPVLTLRKNIPEEILEEL